MVSCSPPVPLVTTAGELDAGISTRPGSDAGTPKGKEVAPGKKPRCRHAGNNYPVATCKEGITWPESGF